MGSIFHDITVAPPIEVFHMNKMYQDDLSPTKVNLTIGGLSLPLIRLRRRAYRTEEGKPWVLPVVKTAETRLADEIRDHEYLPVLGDENFCRAAVDLVLGPTSLAVEERRAFGVQCLSGTGCLKAGADFLRFVSKYTTVYLSKPTWGNHKLVFERAGFTDIREYHYWDSAKRCIDMDGMIKDLKAAPHNSIIVLHGCAHNPTGMDPTQEQWKLIAETIKEHKLFTFFDLAYQGFASGDPDADAWAVRYFVTVGLEMFIAQSFAKNFGLYNERIGNLTIVVSDPSAVSAIKSQMSLVIRANWSNPPNHGAKIVTMILNDCELRKEWHEAIKKMSNRIKSMRVALRQGLEELGTPGTWEHITKQIGMFSYTGLTPGQVDSLVKTHKVFLLKDGRINVCGLNPGNVKFVAKAMYAAILGGH